MNNTQLLEELITISWTAAKSILEYYHTEISVILKEDGSPLTKADIASNNIICRGIKKLTPQIPIISEEFTNTFKVAHKHKTFWLIDPLDGTKEFINKNGEFTTNIALIENEAPVLGVICAPALNILYAGIVNDSAFKVEQDGKRTQITVSKPNQDGYIVVGSRSHNNTNKMNDFLNNKNIAKFLPTGSSLKFCKIAEGHAHLYPRLGRTMEWDTAAGHAILLAAGGHVSTLDKEPLRYGKNGLSNPFFVASI